MKKGIIVYQEWKNEHFNVMTDNEALAVEIELQNGDKVILATIYCPNGNPSLRQFMMINALSVTLCDKLMKAVDTSTPKVCTAATTPNLLLVKPS